MTKWFAYLLGLITCSVGVAADPPATFVRGVNLAGPAVQIDGNAWIAGDDDSVVVRGNAFENQGVMLAPGTDAPRTMMIRSSSWGGTLDVELKDIPGGWYQVFVYQWEDNQTTDFQLLVNDTQVIDRYTTGGAGTWHRLGPFPVNVKGDTIKVSARGGDANLSGIEIWSGRGPLPVLLPTGFTDQPTGDQLAFFESKIRPLLVDRCYQCHSAESDELGGSLLLDSRRGLIVGGDTEPPIIVTDVNASLLIRAVAYRDPDLQMPPDEPLSDTEIADLKTWIAMGVPDPRSDDTIAQYKQRNEIDWDQAREFWSLRPLVKPSLPVVSDSSWPRGDLDRFTLAKMESMGLKPSADGNKESLIRRVTYDLIGLPASPEEIDAFVNDTSAGAFTGLVDRLLESPHYGERWGRYWLDVVRYSDTAGDNSDFPIPQMVKYRDWVIEAFNRDMPYDRFVTEQIAGDLMPADSIGDKHEKTIATGYLAGARRFGSRVDDYPHHLTIEDTIDNVGRAFMGATINCARCHDHKFDPFTTADYYALYGIFRSTRYPWPGIELEQKQRDLIPLVDENVVAQAISERKSAQELLDSVVKDAEHRRDQAAQGSNERASLDKEVELARNAAAKLAKTQLSIEQAYAVCDSTTIDDAAIQIKGNPSKLGDRVERRFLSVLGGETLDPSDHTSGRLQLANWITGENNPLTARVMVNRIWQQHFGNGIVQTSNDFGYQGKPPTNPALLDWLASEFRDSGYSIKSMHRRILLSRTYQLSSELSAEAADVDPANECLTAFPRRRLDADAIRDTLLTMGGTLNLTRPTGEHPFPPQSDWGFTQHNPFKAVYDTDHRSVYLMTQRIQRHPFLAIFDGADPSASTPQRGSSTTPLQSLYFLNDPVVHDQAARFADRILSSSADNEQRFAFAYRTALGRYPTDDETASAVVFLNQCRHAGDNSPDAERAAWQALARVIFRLNEFIYVD